MNDSLKHKIFSETDCISEQTMFDYIDKKLSARESHSLEKHLLHCELCSDALDGLELTKDRGRIAMIHQKIGERLVSSEKEPKIITFNYKLILSIAATVLLLIGGVFFFNQFNQKNEIAEFKSESGVSLSTPPSPVSSASGEDEMLADSINSSVIETVKLEDAAEMSGKHNLNAIQKNAQPSNFEGQGAGPDPKASIAAEKESQSNVEKYNAPVLITENKKGVSVALPRSENNNTSKDERYQRAKEIDLSERSNADAAGIASGEDWLEPKGGATVSKSQAPQSVEQDSDDLNIDKSPKKSTKTTTLFRAEAAEKRKAEKLAAPIDTRDLPGRSADAPESIVAADKNEGLVDETIADDESKLDQMQNRSKSLEKMPEFPGGQDSLVKFIEENFTYPLNYSTGGNAIKKVYVNFIIDEEGKIKSPTILKGVNAAVDKEALRVVNMMPKWKPGTNGGIPVSVKFDLPIKLK